MLNENMMALAENDKAACLVYADWLRDNCEEREAVVYHLAANLNTYNYRKLAIQLVGYEEEVAYKVLPWDFDFGVPRVPLNFGPESIVCARKLIDFLEKKKPEIQKARKELKRQKDLIIKANAGDGKALLAHPKLRAELATLIRKGRSRISEFVTSRKAIAEAKKILTPRIKRIETEQLRPNRIHSMWIEKLMKKAVEMAKSMDGLYRSKYAKVVYGRGGQEEISFHYKGSFKTWAARWRNAGARLDNETKPTCVIVENYMGREVARLPLPTPTLARA